MLRANYFYLIQKTTTALKVHALGDQIIQTLFKELLEPVCCMKQGKKVPDQLLVCRIGDLKDLNDSKLIVYESK